VPVVFVLHSKQRMVPLGFASRGTIRSLWVDNWFFRLWLIDGLSLLRGLCCEKVKEGMS
jgi:hypothetical protein